VEEAKEKDELKMIEGIKDEPTEEEIKEFCFEIGTKIESGMRVLHPDLVNFR
jgi:hypothetical protein